MRRAKRENAADEPEGEERAGVAESLGLKTGGREDARSDDIRDDKRRRRSKTDMLQEGGHGW